MKDNEEIRRPYFDKLSNRTSASSVEPLSTGLGSATFLTHGNGHVNEGEKVANSTKLPLQAAYTPFGEYRIQPSSPTNCPGLAGGCPCAGTSSGRRSKSFMTQ